MRWGKLEVSGGFLLLAAALYYLDDQGVLLWGVLACVLHEMGHYAAIRGLGGRVSRLRLSAAGVEMVLSGARPLGNTGQFLAAVAGPVANLAAAAVSARLAGRLGETCWLFAGLNLGLALFNLLPVEQLDGGRALRCLVAGLWSQAAADRVLGILSALIVEGLALAGAITLWRGGGNLTLLVTAGWLALSMVRQRRKAA